MIDAITLVLPATLLAKKRRKPYLNAYVEVQSGFSSNIKDIINVPENEIPKLKVL
jgi:hypothetical protein